MEAENDEGMYEKDDNNAEIPLDELDSEEESAYNSNEDRMALSTCDEDEDGYPEFNEFTDLDNLKFRMGMLFTTGQALEMQYESMP